MSQYCGSFLHKGLSTHFCALAQGTFKRRINGKNINTHTYRKVANRSTSPLVVPQRIFRPCLYQRVTYSDLLGKKLIFETAARSTVRNFMIFYFLGQTNWIQKHIPSQLKQSFHLNFKFSKTQNWIQGQMCAILKPKVCFEIFLPST